MPSETPINKPMQISRKSFDPGDNFRRGFEFWGVLEGRFFELGGCPETVFFRVELDFDGLDFCAVRRFEVVFLRFETPFSLDFF